VIAIVTHGRGGLGRVWPSSVVEHCVRKAEPSVLFAHPTVGTNTQAPPTLGFGLSFTGGAIALVTGWLAGELTDRLGVGVDDGAHLDALSLSGPVRPSRVAPGPFPVGG
jgi:hypothetical protein